MVVPTEFHSDIRLRSHCTQVVQITVAIDTGGSGVRFALSERDSNTYLYVTAFGRQRKNTLVFQPPVSHHQSLNSPLHIS